MVPGRACIYIYNMYGVWEGNALPGNAVSAGARKIFRDMMPGRKPVIARFLELQTTFCLQWRKGLKKIDIALCFEYCPFALFMHSI